MEEMSFNSFRLPVDLTCLYGDERSWCYIYVEPQKFNVVNDLEAYLQNLFGIPPPVKLFVGKYLLPSSESIKILCVGDVIRVTGGSDLSQPAADHNSSRRKKRKHADVKDKTSSKSASADTSVVRDSPHIAAREDPAARVGSESVDGGVALADGGTASQAVVRPRAPATEDVTRQTEGLQGNAMINSVGSVGDDQSTISTEPAQVDTNMETEASLIPKKRKRTRRHKRKAMVSASVGEAVSLLRSSLGALPSRSSESLLSSFSDHYTNRKHTKFSDDDFDSSIAGESERDVPYVNGNAPNASFNRQVQDPSMKSFSNWDVQDLSNKAPTENFENLLSLRHKAAPLVFERKQAKQKTPDPPTTKVKGQAAASWSETEQKSYVREATNESAPERSMDPNLYPILNSTPKKQDIILFKTLVLTENCVPQLSSFIMAMVVDFCPQSYDVKLQIKNNGQELRQQPLKFAAEVQTESADDEITTLNWNEIHETHLVSRET
ncbi:uncharacterized protein LOC134532865 [Bacillus rossius redtenbacheri]|uniref:uncharacterized protein LOC134532865 n=1 Tax=Bacillus rossius redtenbacheri TaxID=93214 RepID=UPI002FDDA6A5